MPDDIESKESTDIINEEKKPSGERREFSTVPGVSIGGAPLTYIAMLAALIAVFSLIPFSPLLGIAGNLSFSDVFTPQTGILLGPWGGAVASVVGMLLSAFLPNASPFAPLTSIGSGFAALAVGLTVQRGKRWWLFGWAGMLVCWLALVGLAMTRGVSLPVALANTASQIVGLVIWVSPLRRVAADWLRGEGIGRLAAGVAVVFWIGTVTEHVINTLILYALLDWPPTVWEILVPVIPGERLGLTVAATVICTSVIVGMRRMGLLRPGMAGW